MLYNKRYEFAVWAVPGAPDDPGVYCLWVGDELIYIGCAEAPSASIRSRLSDHLSGQTPGPAGITHYAWEISRRPRERELELLQEFERRFGRLPRLNGTTDA